MKCKSMLLIRIWIELHWILAFYLCYPTFSCSKSLIWSSHWHSDTGGCYAQQLTRHCEISAARWRHGNFFIIFLHITSFIDKALLKKPMFLQGGSFCTSILSSKTPGNKISWCSQGGVEILDDEYFGYFLWPRKVWRCSVKNFFVGRNAFLCQQIVLYGAKKISSSKLIPRALWFARKFRVIHHPQVRAVVWSFWIVFNALERHYILVNSQSNWTRPFFKRLTTNCKVYHQSRLVLLISTPYLNSWAEYCHVQINNVNLASCPVSVLFG